MNTTPANDLPRKAAAIPSLNRPQFKLRTLTLAVLSALPVLAHAAGNVAPAPVNPLPTGGTVLVPGTATIVNSAPNLLTINQSAARATINWNSFDIAQGNTVRFNQPSASAEALNYIGGANPSLIQGTLSANGKVYLVNANGIVFDRSAQVNVNTLIASSLNIAQSSFDNGLLSSLTGKPAPTLVATMLLNKAGQVVNYGTLNSVQVDGATGAVQTDAAGKPVAPGGAIMLFAPQVENQGVISANNGQVILAAGQSVYLQLYNDPANPDNKNANDLSMRGFLVKVTAAPAGALNVSKLIAQNLNAQNPNAATNAGEIHSDRGNTTLTGMIVNQSGLISANTATTVNGSIWLKAESYDAGSATTTYGKLTTSKNSVTQTLPEDDGTTLPESAAYAAPNLYASGGYQAVIKLTGETVIHDGTAVAPGGRIVVGKETLNNDDASRPAQSGRVYLGAGSVLSTAGVWVDLAYADSYLTFKLGSLDLADAPLQKGGFLINQTVTVDPRKGTPKLFSIAGQLAAVKRTVNEKATAGGTIAVNTGEFIAAADSKVDVSGGGYRYADGIATTTYLVSRGRLYDIATAPTTLQYDGVKTISAKARGYVQGANAGLLAIDARQMALGGQFAGGATIGPYQRAAGSQPGLGRLVLGTQSILPGSTLDFSTFGDATTVNSLDTQAAQYALHDVSFGDSAATRQQLDAALTDLNADPVNAPFPAALKDDVLLPVDLFGGTRSTQASATQGFGSFALRASGNVSVPQNVDLDLGSGGSLLWLAPQIDIAGTLAAQGGALHFDTALFNGSLHLGASGALSVAGGWINDANDGRVFANAINGGAVTIQGFGALDAGSRIDASGGAQLGSDGKLVYGNGGAIALPTTALDGVDLAAYGGAQGGSLTLAADTIDVGGASTAALSPEFFTQGGFTQYTLAGGSQVNFDASIHPLAYRRIVNARAQLAASGTPFASIGYVQTNAPVALRTAASLDASTAASASSTFQLNPNETGITLAPGVRISTDPSGRISLASQTRMDIEGGLVAPGGRISLVLDPGQRFYYDTASGRFNALTIGDQALLSAAGVFVPTFGQPGLTSGTVLPGGSIAVSARKNDLVVASGALFDVGGTRALVDLPPAPGRSGYARGVVASEGGSVAIDATENAYLDGSFAGYGGDASVAGAAFSLNLRYNGAFDSTTLRSNPIFSAATSNDANAIAALAFRDPSQQQLAHRLIVSQQATPLAHDGSASDSSTIANLTDAQGNYRAALRANISADQLVNGVDWNGARVGGGFDSVTLKSDNQIQFSAGIDNFAPRALLQFDTPELRVQGTGTTRIGSGAAAGASWITAQLDLVNTPDEFRFSTNLAQSVLDANPLFATTPLAAQIPVATQPGSGTLDLIAAQISLAGNVTANGIADFNLSSSGDIRFEGFPVRYLAPTGLSDQVPYINDALALTGRLSSAANIGLQARQIYPATGVDYSVAVEQVTTAALRQDQAGNVSATVSRTPMADGVISIERSSGDAGPVLSVAGTLTLAADHIDQGGTLRAPLGQINLHGGQSLTLADGSVTSVAALWNHDGIETDLTIPYGATQSVGQSLFYGGTPTTAAPAKQISASAATVEVAPGATLDLRGGGDFAAMEFVPGIGGSKDVLSAPGTYAILPGVAAPTADSYLASFDPVGVGAAAAYNSVHLNGGAGLPAGDYVLLPAYYALLPGAYLVKAQGSAYANVDAGYVAPQADGSVIVAGKFGFAGTAISQSAFSGFSVQSGAAALNGLHAQGEYRVTGAQFFADQAAANGNAAGAAPQDGGRLSVGATTALTFEGNLLADAARSANGVAGAIGQVDIYGSKFAIVANNAVAADGYTRLNADELSKLDASVLIGGTRRDTADGLSLDVTASDVRVDLDGGTLRLPELFLAATDRLSVSGSSTLTAVGKVLNRSGTLTITPDTNGNQAGALLGVSAAAPVPVARPGTLDATPGRGDLTIADGATITAPGGSITVDSTGTPSVAGVLTSASLAIGAKRIALGAVPAGSDALALGPTQLAALGSAKNFVLRSYSAIDLYGDVNLGQTGVGSFTFDAAGLYGHDVAGAAAPVVLSAQTIALQNLSGSTQAATTPGSGTLALNADTLVLGDSGTAGFNLAGVSRVDLNAGEVALHGSGTLRSAADTTIDTARIAASARMADQTIAAYDADAQTWHALTIAGNAGATPSATTPQAGGKLHLDGSAVALDTAIALQSGRLNIAAHGAAGSDGVTLKSASSIDLSAYEKTFAQGTANLTQSADAGRLDLSSAHGSVVTEAGSDIDLRGGQSGGDAGALTIVAANGTASLNGKLAAGAAHGKSGSAHIDLAHLANFSQLNAALQSGGFDAQRYLRARSGDIVVAAGDTLTAQAVQLVADAGNIALAGTLDASGAAGGGTVELDAGLGIHLASGSRILAQGTSADTRAAAAYADGGTVGLYARGGTLAFDAGALIDVSANADGKSSGGAVVFSAPKTAGGDALQASLAGQVDTAGGSVSVAGGVVPGGGQVVVEGYQRYADIAATAAVASTSSQVHADFTHFMNASDAIQSDALASLQAGGSAVTAGNLKVRAGIELASSGNMTVDGDWDLTADWLPTGASQTAGRLSLRAAGNLAVDARLGLPNDTSLPPNAGWRLQLAGGADTASADALAVAPSTTQGDVSLSANGKVTTSTGDIQIAAGRDFSAATPASVVYTTGRAIALPILASDPALGGVYFAPASGVDFVDGGSISIVAAGKVGGNGTYAAINDWLRRNSNSPAAALTSPLGQVRGFSYQPAYWWVDRAGNASAQTQGIEGIATLGGGDIAIAAGGSVSNLSVASATSRSAAADATLVKVNGRNNIASANAVYGGGDVRIDAGGDLLGGQYLLGRGAANLSAGGNISGLDGVADSATAPALWLMGYSDDAALQGATVKLEALGNIVLGSVANPTATDVAKDAGRTLANKTPGYMAGHAYFFSYAPNDSLAATAVGGDLRIVGAAAGTAKLTAVNNVLPPRFAATALEGDVSSGSGEVFNQGKLNSDATPGADYSLYQYPDSNGLFQLLAGDSVHDLVLAQSNYDPAVLATASGQALGLDAYKAAKVLPDVFASAKLVTPSDIDGYRYAVVADNGSVADAAFYLPQQSVVAAGLDIANVQLDLQNLSSADLSVVSAGRDLFYSNQLGNGTQWSNLPYLRIAGPGDLLVLAGRNITLGAVSSGAVSDVDDVTRIDAIGNKIDVTKKIGNASLKNADAANLTVLAGVDTASVGVAQVNRLFEVLRSAGLLQGLIGEVQGKTLASDAATTQANAIIADANAALDALYAAGVQPGSAPLHQTPLTPGSASAATLGAAYNRAIAASNDAIAALFHDGQSHSGDITLYNARISSDSNPGGSGGTIDLVAPNGNINVGLPSASSTRNIGVFTSQGGAINAYLNGNLNVNLSKVATFQGGDILLYTSGVGSTLDAGRGSRTATTSSPPRLVAELDASGQPTGKLLLLPPSDISGSGIRTVSYDPDGFGPLAQPLPGRVYLLAPSGTIDAGEAGVSSASGLVVAALVVKNADNFSASGSTVGVPSVAATPVVAPVSSDAASANKAADAAAQAAGSNAATPLDSAAFRPTILNVEVLGFGTGGDDDCTGKDADCRQR